MRKPIKRVQTWVLTYDDYELPEDMKPEYYLVQLMFKRVRQHLKRRGLPTNFKYYIVPEWAEDTNRLHWHCVIYDFPYKPTFKEQQIFWPHGRTEIKYVKDKEKSYKYVTKYFTKALWTTTYHKCKPQMSKKPPLGHDAILDICHRNIIDNRVPDEILPKISFRIDADNPHGKMYTFCCPPYHMELQQKTYEAAGYTFPEKSAIAEELISIGKWLRPSLEEVLKREKKREKRKARFQDLKAREKHTYTKSIKSMVKHQNEIFSATPDLPDEKRKHKKAK